GTPQPRGRASPAELDPGGNTRLRPQPGQPLGGGDAPLPAEAEALVSRIGPVESVSSVANLSATVLRNDQVDQSDTGGITVKAARPSLLHVLRGRVAQGQFLTAANQRYPVVVLGSVAATRLGVITLRHQTAGYPGGRGFDVGGGLARHAREPDRAPDA